MSKPSFKLKPIGKKTKGSDGPRTVFVQKMMAPKAPVEDPPEDPWDIVHKEIRNGDEVVPSQVEVQDDQPILGNLGELGKSIIEPPLTPTELELLVAKNNVLPSLIETMEVNIDGTGFEIVPVDPDSVGDELDDAAPVTEADQMEEGQTDFEPKPPAERALSRDLVAEAEASAAQEAAKQAAIDEARTPIEQFFDECFPGISFLTVRRQLRKDQERVGYAYLEVLRNDAGDVVFCRRLDPKKMRMLRLDEPKPVQRTVERNGQEVTITIHLRDRRYIQRVGKHFVYFKDFGVDQDIVRRTGEWAEPGTLAAEDRGTELLFFKNKDDVLTPYGIPRWLSNIPSVVGSRKAEEFNLGFFDSGGVPPMMILVQGGQLAEDVEQQLTDHFMSTGAQRHQVAILEAYGAGDMDSSQNVKVTVERFGSEQQKDSMFEGYIEKCDSRTRRSFRLPSIFLGEAESFNFATAFASYTVAEAQVFGPERMEFDEVMNLKLMPELPNGKDFKFHSLPLAVRDVAQQLEAAALVQELVEPGSFVQTVNNLVGTELTPKSEKTLQEEADRKVQNLNAEVNANLNPSEGSGRFDQEAGGGDQNPGEDGGKGNGTPDGSTPTRKMVLKDAEKLVELAEEGAELLRKGFNDPISAARYLEHKEKVAKLEGRDLEAYRSLVAAGTFEVISNDPDGVVELAGCVAEVRASRAG